MSLNILLVQSEMNNWRAGRAWSYNMHIGWEAGFKSNGINFYTLTSSFVKQHKRLLKGRRFDQVWINDLVLSAGRPMQDINREQLAFFASLAPVRLGLLTESIFDYTKEEFEELPDMARTLEEVEKCLPFLTHVLAYDETDVPKLKEKWDLPAMWSPAHVDGNFIHQAPAKPSIAKALFSGTIYKGRDQWLSNKELKDCLANMKSPDEGHSYPKYFDRLHHHRLRKLMHHPISAPFYPIYINMVRKIRKQSYENWLLGLQSGLAVVNLPHFVKCYTPRVVEGMAAGRPVLSWKIPDRPKNEQLFVDNKEILLFETPEELAEQIGRLKKDPALPQQIASNARAKILQYHTVEKRVQQIQHWIKEGEAPIFTRKEAEHFKIPQ